MTDTKTKCKFDEVPPGGARYDDKYCQYTDIPDVNIITVKCPT